MDVLQIGTVRLFEQLGLAESDEDIASFIVRNRPLPADLQLHEAPFWTAAQAQLLFEAKVEDAEWSTAVDRLDVSLR